MKNSYEMNGDLVWIRLDRKAQGPLFAMVDKEDLPRLLTFPFKWHSQYVETSHTTYVCSCRNEHGEIKKTYLHRFLMEAPKGMETDHLNHNGLDNRRQNLRTVTRFVNQQNRRGANSRSQTGMLNVVKMRDKFQARIMRDRKSVHLGTFATPEEAKRAADNYLKVSVVQ